MSLKILPLNLLPNLAGPNELKHSCQLIYTYAKMVAISQPVTLHHGFTIIKNKSVFALTQHLGVNHQILSLGQIFYVKCPIKRYKNLRPGLTFDHCHEILVQTM